MRELALIPHEHWSFRFTVMLTLAIVVAVMGLLADSAAVVIGAMLLAPLMTPVLGLAAALAMGLPNKILQSTTRVVLATLWCIVVAYLLSAFSPVSGSIPGEVLSRTSPDLKDLVVALAAGLAGSYATVRADTSASLPGVAVAVALVPPLGTVGISLEAGRIDQAEGALLLYLTNLVAIVVVGIGVFVITGFVPPRRLARTTTRLAASVVISVVAFAAIAFLLLGATRRAAEQAQENLRINEAIQVWLAATPDLRVTGVGKSIGAVADEPNRLSVEIAGPVQPPDKETLRPLIEPILGDVLLSVQWVKTEEATTTVPVSTTTIAPTAEELRLLQIQPLVERWLVVEDRGNGYELSGLFFRENTLRVDVIGTGDPPSVDDLNDLLAAELGSIDFELDVTWIRREVSQPGTTQPDPIEIRRDLMLNAASSFAAANDVAIRLFSFDGRRVEIDLAGSATPDTSELVSALTAIADDDTVEIEIYFTARIRLDPALPTVPVAAPSTTVPATTTTRG